MLPTFSGPVPRGSQEQELRISGSNTLLFQDWVAAVGDVELLGYFRAIQQEVQQRGLASFHFKLTNGRFNRHRNAQDPQFSAVILFGGTDADGPLKVSRCMSCDMDCPLALGVLGEEEPPPAATPAVAAAAPPAADEAPAAADEAPAAADEAPAAADEAPAAADEAPAAADEAPPPAPSSSNVAATNGGALAPSEPAAAREQQQATSAQPPAEQLPQQQQQQQAPPLPAQPMELTSKDTLIRESVHCRAWLDAKARPMFVLTPTQHVEQLADMSDPQLIDLLRTAVSVLQEMGCASFTSMVLNQGDSRNHAHLHLKVRVHEREFEAAAALWPEQHQRRLAALRAFRDGLPPEQRGTHEAFMLRKRRQQQQQGGQGARGRGRGR